jgi:hypothetical protein
MTLSYSTLEAPPLAPPVQPPPASSSLHDARDSNATVGRSAPGAELDAHAHDDDTEPPPLAHHRARAPSSDTLAPGARAFDVLVRALDPDAKLPPAVYALLLTNVLLLAILCVLVVTGAR